MDKRKINQVAEVLSEWNPLGDRAREVEELNGYRTEAVDIIFELDVLSVRGVEAVSRTVHQVLNQAFGLSLSDSECRQPTLQIVQVLGRNQ